MSQEPLFNPDRLTADGLPRDCPSCKGSGQHGHMTSKLTPPPARGGMSTFEEGYREGWKAGYSLGITDGNGQGYSDAKFRAHLAIKAAGLDPGSEKKAIVAITEIVGKQQS